MDEAQEYTVEIKYQELLDRGLNPKADSLYPQLDRLIREKANEYFNSLPGMKGKPWHYISIRFNPNSDTYFVKVALGAAVEKG